MVETLALAGGSVLATPLSLLLLQMLMIVVVSRLLAMVLRRIGQPSVIAEILTGILLGPSVLSRIPSFAEHVFPERSMPFLKIFADIGLILFIFITSLELELSRMGKQLRQSALISLSGIIVPFGLGAAVAVHIYNVLGDPEVPFTTFMLFVATAMSATALPVLARILTETGSIRTTVGQVALAAAAVDDIVAWTLMVVVIAMVSNTGQNIFALWVFLLVVGYTAFMWFAVRPVLRRFVLRWGRRQPNGDATVTPMLLFVILALLLASTWFTESICGIHALFGAVIMGVITPHDDGFAEALAEGLEDLTSQLFVPLYFASIGLKTQVGLLSTGAIWGIEFLVLVSAFAGKMIGSTLAGRYAPGPNFTWRESAAIGILMSNKGLVELIILSIGLEAGVISETLYAVMVVMAIATTTLTQPLLKLTYPKKYWKFPGDNSAPRSDTMPFINTESTRDAQGKAQPAKILRLLRTSDKLRVMVCLPSTTAVSSMARITSQLVRAHPPPIATSASGAAPTALPQPRIQLTALRLLPLSASRHSAVMRAAHAPERMAQADPALSLFASFMNVDAHNAPEASGLHRQAQQGSMFLRTLLAIVGASDAGAEDVTVTAAAVSAQVVLLPLSLVHPVVSTAYAGAHAGAGDGLLATSVRTDRLVVDPENLSQRTLLKRTVERSPSTVVVVLDRGFGDMPQMWTTSTSMTGPAREPPRNLIRRYHKRVLLIFQGGHADLEALKFVARLCGLVPSADDVSEDWTHAAAGRPSRSQMDMTDWKIDVLVVDTTAPVVAMPKPTELLRARRPSETFSVRMGIAGPGAKPAPAAAAKAAPPPPPPPPLPSSPSSTATLAMAPPAAAPVSVPATPLASLPERLSSECHTSLVEQFALLAPGVVHLHACPPAVNPAAEVLSFCRREAYEGRDAVVLGASALAWVVRAGIDDTESRPPSLTDTRASSMTEIATPPVPNNPAASTAVHIGVADAAAGALGQSPGQGHATAPGTGTGLGRYRLQTWAESMAAVSIFAVHPPARGQAAESSMLLSPV